MSRWRVSLAAAQLSFLNKTACQTIEQDTDAKCWDERPSKRRKVDPEADGWAAILEFVIDCPFQEGCTTYPTSTVVNSEASFVGAAIEFNDPVMTVSNPRTEQDLFGFVCDEEITKVLEKVMWYNKLARKDRSISRCLRCQTAILIQQTADGVEGAVVSVLVEVQFDHNLAQVTKLTPKDRLAVLDHALEKQYSEVSPDKFYSDLGRLPKDYISAEKEKELQHPSISCSLFPFQKRAVAWMLERERRSPAILEANHIDTAEPQQRDLPALWETLTDLKHRVFYINRHQGYLTLDKTWVSKYFTTEKTYGGLLAEVTVDFGEVLIV
jgi:hypothetical protein